MFVSEDRQLRVVHLTLDFEPLSSQFQEVGHAIRVGDPQLARVDVLMPGFLAREDLLLVELPFHHSSHEVAAPKEKTASSHLSLEVEIDQFLLEEEGVEQGEHVEIMDSEGALDRSSTVHPPKLIVAWVDSSFEEEEEMALNLRKGLKDLLVVRNKRSSSKEAPKSQPSPTLPPPPPFAFNLLLMPNLKKKRKEKEGAEEGELVPQKEPKQ